MDTTEDLQNKLAEAQLLHAQLQAQLQVHTEHGLLTTTDNLLASSSSSSSSLTAAPTGLEGVGTELMTSTTEATPNKSTDTPSSGGLKPNKRKLMDLFALDENYHWVKRNNVYKREIRARAQAIVDSGTTTWDGPPNVTHLHGVVLRGTGSASTVNYNPDGTPSTAYPTFANGSGAYIYYEANIWLDTQSLTLGCFKTRLEAAVAFDYAQTYLRPSLRSGSGKLLTLNFAGTPSDCRVYGPIDPWPVSVLAQNLPLPAHNPDGFGGHVLVPHPEDEVPEKRPPRPRYDQVQLDPNDPMAFINADDVMNGGPKRRKRQSAGKANAESSSLLAQMDQLPNANLVSSYPLVSIPIDPNDPNSGYYYANATGIQPNTGQMIAYNYNPTTAQVVASPDTTTNPPKKQRRRSKANADATAATATATTPATTTAFPGSTFVMYNAQNQPVVSPQYSYGYTTTPYPHQQYIYQTAGNSFLTTTTNPDGSTTTTTTTTVPNVVDNRPPETVNYATVPPNNSFPLIIQTMPNGQPAYYTAGPSGLPMPATTTYVIVSPTSVALPGTTVPPGSTTTTTVTAQPVVASTTEVPASTDANRAATDPNTATTTVLSSTTGDTGTTQPSSGTASATMVFQGYPSATNYNYSYYPMPAQQVVVNATSGTTDGTTTLSSGATTTMVLSSTPTDNKTVEQDQGVV